MTRRPPRTTLLPYTTPFRSREVPYRVHPVLTDTGVPFSDQARTGERLLVHPFPRLCRARGLEHRLTKPYHPWTNGQAERMVRTVKDATVHAFPYATIPDRKSVV